MFKSVKCLMLIVVCMSLYSSGSITDVYDLNMTLKIPRVYNNTESLGYRKLQTQRFSGKMLVQYNENDRPNITILDLVNKTQKLSSGKCITYECYTTGLTRFNYIGDNRRNMFTTPSLRFSLAAEPSYALTDLQEDNSMYLELAGYGAVSKTIIKQCTIPIRLSGYVVGTLGCGCSDYGHVSPTRIIGPCMFEDIIDDVAPVYGTWHIRFKTRLYY